MFKTKSFQEADPHHRQKARTISRFGFRNKFRGQRERIVVIIIVTSLIEIVIIRFWFATNRE